MIARDVSVSSLRARRRLALRRRQRCSSTPRATARTRAQAIALLGGARRLRISARPTGRRPLHWAVHHDDAELVDRLLEAGATSQPRTTTARRRCRKPRSTATTAVLEALLDAGADVESPNADGQTALMVVARSGNVGGGRAAARARRRRQCAGAVARPDGVDVGRGAEPARDGEAADRARRRRRCALHGQRLGAAGDGRAAAEEPAGRRLHAAAVSPRAKAASSACARSWRRAPTSISRTPTASRRC